MKYTQKILCSGDSVRVLLLLLPTAGWPVDRCFLQTLSWQKGWMNLPMTWLLPTQPPGQRRKRTAGKGTGARWEESYPTDPCPWGRLTRKRSDSSLQANTGHMVKLSLIFIGNSLIFTPAPGSASYSSKLWRGPAARFPRFPFWNQPRPSYHCPIENVSDWFTRWMCVCTSLWEVQTISEMFHLVCCFSNPDYPETAAQVKNTIQLSTNCTWSDHLVVWTNRLEF